MKINFDNCLAGVRHLQALNKMLKESPGPYPFSSFYELRNLEKRTHRLATISCERELTEIENLALEKIESKVKAMFKPRFAKQIFINMDCRGYALKIRSIKPENIERECKGLSFDWGRYGILAPQF